MNIQPVIKKTFFEGLLIGLIVGIATALFVYVFWIISFIILITRVQIMYSRMFS